MDITIKLHGWADSFKGYKQVEFVLQIVMWQLTGDCDYEFKIECESDGDVRYKSKFKIKAERYHSLGFKSKSDNYEIGVTCYNFSFEVPCYTKSYIYKFAYKAVKEMLQREQREGEE